MSSLARDSLLHWVHFAFIFTLVSLLACEIALFGQSVSRRAFNRLRVIDRWYGIFAGLVILSGIGLLTGGLKPATFFTHNPVFWTKMALFLCIALLSIPMTITLIRTPDGTGGDDAVTFSEFGRLRTFLWLQVAVLIFIPLCAALMANGI